MDINDVLLMTSFSGGGSGCGINPSGSIYIDGNGIYNIAKYASAEVDVPEPSGIITISSNGDTNVYNYAIARINVPNPSAGTLSISSNGTYNVTDYASAAVNVSGIIEDTLYSGTISANVTSNTPTQLTSIALDAGTVVANKLLRVSIRYTGSEDVNGRFIGSDSFVCPWTGLNGTSSTGYKTAVLYYTKLDNAVGGGAFASGEANTRLFGMWAELSTYGGVDSGGRSVTIYGRYLAAYTGTISGPYSITVTRRDFNGPF